MKNKVITSLLLKAVNHAGCIIVLLAVLSFNLGCSMIRTYKHAPTLASVTANQTYQVRVRTGNLALDKIMYEYAVSEFGRYLIVSRKGPFTGYIDIVFESTSTTPLTVIPFSMIPWKKPLPGVKTNVAYGDAWFTGNDDMRLKGISQTTLTEITPGNMATWLDGTMRVTLKDINMTTFWSADYKYRGAWDLSGFVYVHTADEAARLCFYTIVEKFIQDYITDPMERKAAMEEAARRAEEKEDAARRAGEGFMSEKEEKEMKDKSKIALFKKSDKPPEPEKPIQLDTKKWRFTGNNKAGVPVHIDKTSISYPDDYVVQLWAATIRNNIQKVHLYEIGCLENKYRMINQTVDTSVPLFTGGWEDIVPESTPEVIYHAVCPKDARLKQQLNDTTSLKSEKIVLSVKTPETENRPAASGEVTRKGKDVAEGTAPPKTEEVNQKAENAAKEMEPLKTEEVTQSAESPAKGIEAPATEGMTQGTGDTAKNAGSPQSAEAITMDAKKWKFLGRNNKEFPVHIDKLTISYPAAYVVQLWATTVNDTHNIELNLYEIGCLEKEFRVIGDTNGRQKSRSLSSREWETISPASTPELIYNAVCPKKIRLTQMQPGTAPDSGGLDHTSENTIVDNQFSGPVEAVQGSNDTVRDIESSNPESAEAVQLDEGKWKLLGRNNKEIPVHIDKLTISYPDTYVVRLRAATVSDNQKEETLYEIGCLEGKFRIMDENTGKPRSSSLWSDGWETISSESTPELIYNAVCPKKIREKRQMARK